ncbi:MAG: crotonase/enoyl-CoA hydratase family protein [Deferrisomatales bacterium]|nr:crotonase/enoyl-CoA hydratase family protein [Deferrisomatales bacterium]
MDNLHVMPALGVYEQLNVNYNVQQKSVWYLLKTKPIPCFNHEILRELKLLQSRIVRLSSVDNHGTGSQSVEYIVLASDVDGVFNYGGDLRLFVNLIKQGDADALRRYAKACIDVLYPNSAGLGVGLTSISLVQGDALGGGCEAALSSHVTIAEESAKFGLPEVLFNLIPGMGAYSILSRRIPPASAERIILGGELHSARQFYDLGLIDAVVPDGEGERAVAEFIRAHRKRRNAHRALRQVRERVHPMSYDELMAVTDLWVDAALRLEARDLRMMERLARAQERNTREGAGAAALLQG